MALAFGRESNNRIAEHTQPKNLYPHTLLKDANGRFDWNWKCRSMRRRLSTLPHTTSHHKPHSRSTKYKLYITYAVCWYKCKVSINSVREADSYGCCSVMKPLAFLVGAAVLLSCRYIAIAPAHHFTIFNMHKQGDILAKPENLWLCSAWKDATPEHCGSTKR